MIHPAPPCFVVAVVGLTALIAGCTSHSNAPLPTLTRTVVQTRTSTPPSAPLDTGPTTAATAADCPFISLSTAMTIIGQRLASTKQLHQAGRVIGCQFFALQTGPLHTSENLPGPNQPSLQVVTTRYPSTLAAHNALAVLGGKGANAYQRVLPNGTVGVSFQTRFDPADGSNDWAYAFNKAALLIVVTTADPTASDNAFTVAGELTT